MIVLPDDSNRNDVVLQLYTRSGDLRRREGRGQAQERPLEPLLRLQDQILEA